MRPRNRNLILALLFQLVVSGCETPPEGEADHGLQVDTGSVAADTAAVFEVPAELRDP